MVLQDDVFGQLTYDDEDWGDWYANVSLELGGKTYSVGLLVNGDDDENIVDAQREAYARFMEQWPRLQPLLLDELLRYYNEEERDSYGPDDEEENAEWWPEIETREAMLEAVTPEMIVVPADFMQEEGRRVYLLFNRIWGGEDLDDNGVAAAFFNEEIEEIGFKEMAF